MAIAQQYDTLACLENLLRHVRRCSTHTNNPSGPLCDIDESLGKMRDLWVAAQASMPMIIASMLTERNKLVPVSKLPVEILCRIFHFASSESGDTGSSCRTVVAISHTCVFWRSAIVNFPSVWTHIDMAHRSAAISASVANLFAARSRQRPLSVVDIWRSHCRPDASNAQRVAFWQREVHRMKDVVLTISADSTPACVELVHAATNGPAPLLESLTLAQRTSFGAAQGHVFPLSVLFSQKTPKLRSLSLLNIRLPWSSPLYRCGLTRLCIRLAVDDWTGQPDDTSILSVFADSPALEDIELSITSLHKGLGRYFTRGEDDADDEDRPLTPLPHARRVHFEMDPYDMAVILSSVVLPEEMDALVLKPTVTGLLARVIPDNQECLPCLANIQDVLIDFQAGEVHARTASSSSARTSDSNEVEHRDHLAPSRPYNLSFILNTPATLPGALPILRFDAYTDLLTKIHLVNSLSLLRSITIKGLLAPWMSSSLLAQLLHCAPAPGLHRLVLDACPEEIVDILVDVLHESGTTVGEVWFVKMDLEVDDLAELYSTTRTRAETRNSLEGIHLKDCVVHTDSVQYAREVLDMLRKGLETAAFDGVSFSVNDEDGDGEDDREASEETSSILA